MVGNLTIAMKAAQSGLLTTQAALEASAQNISNVNTEGYSRKNVNTESRVVGGVGAGVQLADFTRDIDEGLVRDLRSEYTDFHEVDVKDRYFERMEELFGSPGANTSIAHNLTQFAEALETLAVNPSQLTEQSEVVRMAQRLSDQVNHMTTALQDLRLQADQQIEDVVDRINTLTSDIASLNDKIVRNSAVSHDVNDLLDKRDIALSELSQLIDIQYYQDNSGAMQVYTEAGTTLVGADAQRMTHVAVTQIGATSTHETGQINGIFIGEATTYEDITNSVRGGQLKGLIDLRDTTLNNLQNELDGMSAELMDSYNRIHNRGTPFPGLDSVTGSKSFDAINADMGDNRFTTLPLEFSTSQNYEEDATITGPRGTFLDGNGEPLKAGTQITFSNTDPSNGDEGTTYTIASVDSTGTTATLVPTDTISDANNFKGVMSIANAPTVTIGEGESVDIVIFDSEGKQVDTAQIPAGTYTISDGSPDSLVGFLNNFLANGNLQDETYGSAEMDGKNRLSLNMNSGYTIAFKDNGTDSSGDVSMQLDYTNDGETDETTMGFSNFFGLNDFFETNLNQDYYQSEQKTEGWNWTVPTNGASLSFRSDGGQSETLSFTPGDRMSLQDIADAINDPDNGISFVTATVVTDGSGQVLRMVHDDSKNMVIDDGLNGRIFNDLGIRTSPVRSAGQINVREDIQTNPQAISTGQMQKDSATGEYQIGRGDNDIPEALANMFTEKQTFLANGSIGNSKATFNEYASNIIASVASQSSNNKIDQEYLSGLTSSLKSKHESLSGVNLDEEMSNLILFEQAYGAAARVISTIDEMFDTLNNMAR